MLSRLSFNPALPTVARTSFRFAGKDFFPGDPFPGDLPEGACSDRRRYQMWGSRHIECVMTIPEAPAPKSPKPRKAREPKVAEPATVGIQIKSTGFGLFSVINDSIVIATGLKRSAANELAASISTETRRGAGESAPDIGDVCPPVSGAPSNPDQPAAA